MDVASRPPTSVAGAVPIDDLARWLLARQPVAVLTGAGISTASGIPDYRDVDGQWKRAQPVTYQAFTGSAAVRQRYWARSFVGWPHFAATLPNAAHKILARLEADGLIAGVVTQNVDRLHTHAGSRNVVDLHGRLDEVVCLECHRRYPRDGLQQRLMALNSGWEAVNVRVAPDGDADLGSADYASFVVADCPSCGGLLKPDVVFFGGSVPPERRQRAADLIAAARGVLVVGSSLMVWSGFRLVRAAAARGASIAAINIGRTRAEELLAIKCVGDCGTLLDALSDRLAAVAHQTGAH